MKRKLSALALAAALTVTGFAAAPAQAAQVSDSFYRDLAALTSSADDSHYFAEMTLTLGSKSLTLDGQDQALDVAPIVKDNRTLMPIRFIAEAIGADVGWNGATGTVTITSPYGEVITCPIGGRALTVDGLTQSLDVPATAFNNRTYLPVRAVSEALGLDVKWDAAEPNTVTFTAPFQTCRLILFNDNRVWHNIQPLREITDGKGLHVLSYESPTQARAAFEDLHARGMEVSPDLYLPPVDDMTGSGSNSFSGHTTWGADKAHFDQFIAAHPGQGDEVVAVIDTGVSDHPLLKGRLLPGKDLVTGDNDPHDEHYHGTHVATTITDCCGDLSVSILPVRVLGRNGSGSTANVVAGVRYAADHNADVINMSLGGACYESGCAMRKAIDYAIEKGVTVVSAAGNDAENAKNTCPAHTGDEMGSVVVTAGTSSKNAAWFTNYGKVCDLMAPGVDIKAGAPGGGYRTLSGTSMASPHVAAAAACIDLATGKALTPAQIEGIIRTAVTPLGSDSYGVGYLDLEKAVLDGQDPVPPQPENPIVRYEFNESKLALQVGGTAKLTVTAVMKDGTRKDVTGLSRLTSTDPTVAAVDEKTGTVTGKAAGSAFVAMQVAAPDGVVVPAPVAVTVTAPEVPPVKPNPGIVRYEWSSKTDIRVGVGQNVSLPKLYAVKGDGTRIDVSASARFYTLDKEIASVAGSSINGVKVGETWLSFGFAGTDAAIPVPAPIKIVCYDPAPVYTRLYWAIANDNTSLQSIELGLGRTLQVDVYGVTRDGKTVNLTSLCKPYTSDPDIVSISPTGLLTAKAPGTVYLWIESIPNSGLEMPPLLEINVR